MVDPKQMEASKEMREIEAELARLEEYPHAQQIKIRKDVRRRTVEITAAEAQCIIEHYLRLNEVSCIEIDASSADITHWTNRAQELANAFEIDGRIMQLEVRKSVVREREEQNDVALAED